MTVTYNADLTDPISRLRAALGDPAGTLPDATYEAILLGSTDEASAKRSLAALLAAYYASQPDRVSDDGSTLSWGKRIDQLNKIAAGQDGISVSINVAANLAAATLGAPIIVDF